MGSRSRKMEKYYQKVDGQRLYRCLHPDRWEYFGNRGWKQLRGQTELRVIEGRKYLFRSHRRNFRIEVEPHGHIA
jgi:hypothetical protein